jgi:hypothetical protein
MIETYAAVNSVKAPPNGALKALWIQIDLAVCPETFHALDLEHIESALLNQPAGKPNLVVIRILV